MIAKRLHRDVMMFHKAQHANLRTLRFFLRQGGAKR
jgi:hypothetical protein